MMPIDSPTEELMQRVGRGDDQALQVLLDRHRARLRGAVALHMDRRLSPRIDPSDIVQEALGDAHRKLPAYLLDPPISFYPWLRRLALERLIQAHRRHLRSSSRSVDRERRDRPALPEESALLLVERLADRQASPSQALARAERNGQLRAALDRLPQADREVLVLRYLEELPFGEIADILGVKLGAIKMRHLRALQRLHDLLSAGDGSVHP
ncbi:sigma-70 family RNA polymerase sigma factor [Tundrisphaera lichenicola]|uniref:sigma-70 family RNA polymerase sigma factor n=1 Tax=Tundrisphaera lichenicola TaxID=2029860 RepID=UPI003EC14FF5